MGDVLEPAPKCPWLPTLLFPVVQISRERCGSRALLDWDPSSVFLEGRFEGGLINRVFSASQVEGHIEKVYTNSWRADCRRDK